VTHNTLCGWDNSPIVRHLCLRSGYELSPDSSYKVFIHENTSTYGGTSLWFSHLGCRDAGQEASTELNIIIIIIVSKTALFEPRPSARLHLVFSSLDLMTFFTQQGRQPCVQPPNLEDQVSVFMSPSSGLENRD
jgi:hypothetical protein